MKRSYTRDTSTMYRFIETVYKNFGHRSISSLYDKCMEVLDLIQMGYEVRDYKNNTIEDFRLVDSKSAHAIRQNITKEMIRDFLQTKEVYQVM